MRGAVAAGNRDTAEAGAWAIREGGTCVDAALAAVFAAFVTEGPLTGPAGGGFVLLHEPGSSATLLDCFFAVPSRPQGDMDEVEIDFADASTQVFHVGEASVAVPGLMPGLREAHERRGLLPWARLFVPALELARASLRRPREAQAFLHEILVPILQREPAGGRVYGTPGVIDATDLVPALQVLRDVGPEALASARARGRGRPGDATASRSTTRSKARSTARVVLTTPEPSRGGAVVQRGLAALDGHDRGRPGSARRGARARCRARGRVRPGRRVGRTPDRHHPRLGASTRTARR